MRDIAGFCAQRRILVVLDDAGQAACRLIAGGRSSTLLTTSRADPFEGMAVISIDPVDDRGPRRALAGLGSEHRKLLAAACACGDAPFRPRLLDAAHIVGDLEVHGEPVVANGVSLCSIHHRAFDEDLVGISPDDDVHVSRRLLEEEDGPMLELLKGFHRRPIKAPKRPAWRPNRERLAERFERFLAAT